MSELIGGLVFIVLGLIGTYLGYKYVSRWYVISRTDPISIRDSVVTDEVVSISGSANPVQDELLVSPITDEECLAYEYNVKQRKSGGKNKMLDTGSDSQAFIIDDGTAKAYISADEVDITKERITDVNENELQESVITKPSLTGGRVYEEGTIKPGEEVFVVGSTTSTNKYDADTEVVDTGGRFLVSNVSREKTARKSLLYSISLLIGIGLLAIGLSIIL